MNLATIPQSFVTIPGIKASPLNGDIVVTIYNQKK